MINLPFLSGNSHTRARLCQEHSMNTNLNFIIWKLSFSIHRASHVGFHWALPFEWMNMNIEQFHNRNSIGAIVIQLALLSMHDSTKTSSFNGWSLELPRRPWRCVCGTYGIMIICSALGGIQIFTLYHFSPLPFRILNFEFQRRTYLFIGFVLFTGWLINGIYRRGKRDSNWYRK